MGDSSPPTAADYAADNARSARQKADTLEMRLAALEKRVVALENPPCCKGGPQWGHAWDCPECPD